MYVQKKDISALKSGNINIKRFQSVNDRYIITSVIKKDAKGDVMKALFFKGFLQPARCVIKQGRAFACRDSIGRDMCDRILWQLTVQRELESFVRIPKVIDHFYKGEDLFLVSEYIKGKTFEAKTYDLHKGKSWECLRQTTQKKILGLIVRAIQTVSKIHAKGYIHRDLNHANFLLTSAGQVVIIDFELAFSIQKKQPLTSLQTWHLWIYVTRTSARRIADS